MAPALPTSHRAQRTHGRQVGIKPSVWKALHAPAFVVHADQKVEARAVMAVHRALKPGHDWQSCGQTGSAPHQRMRQSLAVGSGQGGSGDVDDERSVQGMALEP